MLPCTQLKTPKVTILIDTGATNSLMDPELATKLYPDNIYEEGFLLKTRKAEILHKECAEVDLFGNGRPLKFHLAKFHNTLPILLGSDNLTRMEAQIDDGREAIVLNEKSYPILKYDSLRERMEIKPKTEVFHTSIKKGVVLVPEQQIGKTKIPASLATVGNYVCEIPVRGEE